MPVDEANNSNTHTRIHLLDAWRFIAIVLVLACHLVYHPVFQTLFSAPALSVFQSHGRVGVLIFFFISGHVVSRAALAEVARNGRFSMSAFYVRRLFRIAPPLMLYLGVCLVLGKQGIIPFDATQFLAANLYLCNTSIECGWFVEHTWSLAFEEQFYLVFPLLFCWIEIRQKPRWPWALIAGCVLLVPAVFPRMGLNPFIQAHFLFLSGYACARHQEALHKMISGHAVMIFCISAALVFFPYGLFIDSHAGWFRAIFTLAIPPMIMASLTLKPALTRWAQPAAVLHIGRVSYSIYLWQQLATYTQYRNHGLLTEIIRVLLVIPLAIVLFRYFEQPLIRLGRIHATRFINTADRKAAFRHPGYSNHADESGPGNSPAQTSSPGGR